MAMAQAADGRAAETMFTMNPTDHLTDRRAITALRIPNRTLNQIPNQHAMKAREEDHTIIQTTITNNPLPEAAGLPTKVATGTAVETTIAEAGAVTITTVARGAAVTTTVAVVHGVVVDVRQAEVQVVVEVAEVVHQVVAVEVMEVADVNQQLI